MHQSLQLLGFYLNKHQILLEFGTGAGRTTWVMAQNPPPNARILTINLTRDQAEKIELADTDDDHKWAIQDDSQYSELFFDRSDVSNKITLKSMDSKLFDENSINKKFDLIFVDGGHAHSYVKSDTEKAFKLLAPGGIIVWMG
jgi:predicted O-methyltransferase YrrM